jgi:PadR family transcriptional regulator PadR
MNTEAATRKLQKELNAGASAVVVLGLLRRTGREMYGYEIGKRLEELAQGSLPMHQGALYPTLRSLEKGGLLSSEVEPSTAGPPRRYYRITPLGLEALAEWQTAWKRTKRFVDSVLEGTHGDESGRRAGNSKVSRGPRRKTAPEPGNQSRGRTG